MGKIVTGTYYLRPNSDISINHSASTSPAWQSVADDDPETKIYTNSTNDCTSTFGLGLYSGTIPSKDYTITSVEIHANHQADFNIVGPGYFQYGYSMGGHSFTASQVSISKNDRVDHTETEAELSISVSANSLPSNPQVWAQCHRKTTLSRWNVQVTQIYVAVNWQYELPYLSVAVIDNTANRRANWPTNVYFEPVEKDIEFYENMEIVTELDSSRVVGLSRFTTLPSNVSNTLNCIITDPTMACVWGYMDKSNTTPDYAVNWVYDGVSGTGGGFGQVSSDTGLYCMIIDAKIYKGNEPMLPITRPIYVGNNRVSSVIYGVDFMYGFYGYKLASDGHHLIADTANYPPDEEVIVEE